MHILDMVQCCNYNKTNNNKDIIIATSKNAYVHHMKFLRRKI